MISTTIRRLAHELASARTRADRDLPHRDDYQAGRADGIMTAAAALGILEDVERAIDLESGARREAKPAELDAIAAANGVSTDLLVSLAGAELGRILSLSDDDAFASA